MDKEKKTLMHNLGNTNMCGGRCISCPLSFIILCTNAFIVGFGAVLLTNYYGFEEFLLPGYWKPIEIILSFAVITTIISCFGCLGLIQGTIYSVLLCLCFVLQFIVLMVTISLRDNMGIEIMKHMNATLLNYNNDNIARQSWDDVQEKMKCCGLYSPLDWYSQHIHGPQINFQNFNFTVPFTCCSGTSCNTLFIKGCFIILSIYVDDASKLFLYTTAGDILLMLLAAVLVYRINPSAGDGPVLPGYGSTQTTLDGYHPINDEY